MLDKHRVGGSLTGQVRCLGSASSHSGRNADTLFCIAAVCWWCYFAELNPDPACGSSSDHPAPLLVQEQSSVITHADGKDIQESLA